LNSDEKDVSIQELYSEVVDNDSRNRQIVEDVLDSYKRGRNCIVLTSRTAHVELLVKKLREDVPDVVMLMGGTGTKTTREVFKRIKDTPADRNIILVATGSFTAVLKKASCA
jgi:superfamily II DNA/RNA helicase